MRLALTIICAPLLVAPATAAAAVPVPKKARAASTSHPDRWVGHGSARSCTSRAVVRAVAKGGGSGGAIYTDGDDFRVLIAGTTMRRNHAREGGGAIFFVSNDRTGTLEIRSSSLRNNPSDGFENSPGIFFLGRRLIR